MWKFITTSVTVWALLLPASPAFAAVGLTDPLGETDVRLIIERVINAAIGISGSLALLMFVYGGILWLTSMGNPTQVEKGKQILIWSVLGMGLIAFAYAITYTVFNALLTGEVTVE